MIATFARAWALLRRNPIVVVPSLAVALVSATVTYVLAGSGAMSWTFFGDMDAQGPAAFWLFLATIVALAWRIFGALAVIAFTTGMAGAAWERGRATLTDGAWAFRRRGLQVLLALAILFIAGVTAAALVVPTFGIALLAYMIFFLYAMPSAIVGGRNAVEAIVESVGIAWRNFGTTLAVVALVVLLAIAGSAIGSATGRLPFLGEAIAWIVMEITVAYATLLVTGEYLALRPPAEAPQP